MTLIIVAIRIAFLMVSNVNLGTDETQYWFWSQNLDFGYFSKPPVIAWTIAFTSGLFGNAEWAIRLASPVIHGGTAILLFATARMLHSAKAGFWVGGTWLLLPAVSLSSNLISTDVVLLFFWSGGLFFLIRILNAVEREPTKMAPLADRFSLGACLGLGLLTKYAMVYFLIAMSVTALCIPQYRKTAAREALVIPLLLAVLIFLPNIIWNSHHESLTLTHTVANAKWEGGFFNPIQLLEFWISQIAIIGPVLFIAFLIYLFMGRNDTNNNVPNSSVQIKRATKLLLIFALTPLVIISIQAFLSRAHANWAATAYPSTLILTSIWLLRAKKEHWLVLNLGLNLIIFAALSMAISNFVILDNIGLSNSIKRVRGWDIQGQEIEKLANQYNHVMADHRDVFGAVAYYAKQSDRDLMAWNSNHRIDDHYEVFHDFRPDVSGKILYITYHPEALGVTPWFSEVKLLKTSELDLKAGRKRTLYFYEIDGFKGSPLYPKKG